MRYTALGLFLILVLSTFTFLPHSAVAETEWKVYKLSYGDQVFKIPYKITPHGNVTKMETYTVYASLRILLANINQDDSIEITIPRNLIDAKMANGVDDYTFTVVVNGNESKYEEVAKSSCFRTLSIPLHTGSTEVEIIAPVSDEPPYGGRSDVEPIHVVTDKSSYKLNERIAVSGCTNLDLDDKVMTLQILNPEGKIYKTLSLIPNVDGMFSVSFVLEGELAINGTYTATATYAGHSATTSFVIPEFSVFMLSVTLLLSVVMLVYFTRIKNKRNIF